MPCVASAAVPPPPAAPRDAAPGSNSIFRKTKACKFHLMGRCTRGEACMFAHGEQEMQPLPDFRRTKMCPSLCETGRCDKGIACLYAHSTKELRNSTKAIAAAARAPASAQSRAAKLLPPPPPLAAVPPATVAPAVAPAPAASAAALAPAPAPVAAAVAVEARVLLVPSGQQVIVLPCATVQQAQSLQAVLLPCATNPPQQQQQQPQPQVQPQPQPQACGAGIVHLPPATYTSDDGQALPPPPDHAPEVSEEALREALEELSAKSGKRSIPEFGLGLPDGAWSRQSTEEGALDASPDFSRQSTEDSWIGMDELETPKESVEANVSEETQLAGDMQQGSEIETKTECGMPHPAATAPFYPKLLGRSEIQTKTECGMPRPAATAPFYPKLPAIAASFGLQCRVANTFLEFRPQQIVGDKLCRSLSTGEFPSCAF